MALQVIEGTWEEIKRHEAELVGRYLRITIKPSPAKHRTEKAAAKKSSAKAQPKVLRGMGAFRGKTGGSEEFAREKRVEIEREERRF